MKIDENSMDPFTVARMTDHNVRGVDDDELEPVSDSPDTAQQTTPKLTSDEEGHYDVDGVSLARRKGFKVVVGSDAKR